MGSLKRDYEFDTITYQLRNGFGELADFYENSNFHVTFSLQVMIL